MPAQPVAAPVQSSAQPPLSALAAKQVVVLPDLFIDALASLPPWGRTGAVIDAIARRGGGNLPVGPVQVRLGGNAANLALALARLGARVELIAETNEIGRDLLRQAAKGTRLGTGRVRVGAEASVTLGLECEDANVMLSHAGPLVAYGPERLRRKDWRLLEKADAVALVNWAQNRHGTALLAALSARLAKRGVPLYLDTGDPRHRLEDARALVEDAALWRGVRAWSLNENESRAFTGDAGGDGMVHLKDLSARLGVRLDVHTRDWAASVSGPSVVQVSAEPGKARRLTGAGDVWNAGNIAADLLGWPERERLRLAHRVATRYVTSEDGLAPLGRELAREG